jgi:hypothetical protein
MGENFEQDFVREICKLGPRFRLQARPFRGGLEVGLVSGGHASLVVVGLTLRVSRLFFRQNWKASRRSESAENCARFLNLFYFLNFLSRGTYTPKMGGGGAFVVEKI